MVAGLANAASEESLQISNHGFSFESANSEHLLGAGTDCVRVLTFLRDSRTVSVAWSNGYLQTKYREKAVCHSLKVHTRLNEALIKIAVAGCRHGRVRIPNLLSLQLTRETSTRIDPVAKVERSACPSIPLYTQDDHWHQCMNLAHALV